MRQRCTKSRLDFPGLVGDTALALEEAHDAEVGTGWASVVSFFLCNFQGSVTVSRPAELCSDVTGFFPLLFAISVCR